MLAYFKNLSNVRKLIVYIGSSIVEGAVDVHLVPDRYTHYVQLSLFFLTSIGIYGARNQKPTVQSAVLAAAQAAETVATGQVPDTATLRSELNATVAGPPTQPLPITLQPTG